MNKVSANDTWMLCQITDDWTHFVAAAETATELLAKVNEFIRELQEIAKQNMASIRQLNCVGEFTFDPDTLTVYARSIEGYEHKPGNKFITSVLADTKTVHAQYTLFKIEKVDYEQFVVALQAESPAPENITDPTPYPV